MNRHPTLSAETPFHSMSRMFVFGSVSARATAATIDLVARSAAATSRRTTTLAPARGNKSATCRDYYRLSRICSRISVSLPHLTAPRPCRLAGRSLLLAKRCADRRDNAWPAAKNAPPAGTAAGQLDEGD